MEKNKSDITNTQKCNISIKISVYQTMFKNGEGQSNKKFGNNQPDKESSSFSSTNLKNLNTGFKMTSTSIFEQKSIQRKDFSEQKFKTIYGFNMNVKPTNYLYKKNFHKENRSISPSQKLVENSQQILVSEKETNNVLSNNFIIV